MQTCPPQGHPNTTHCEPKTASLTKPAKSSSIAITFKQIQAKLLKIYDITMLARDAVMDRAAGVCSRVHNNLHETPTSCIGPCLQGPVPWICTAEPTKFDVQSLHPKESRQNPTNQLQLFELQIRKWTWRWFCAWSLESASKS